MQLLKELAFYVNVNDFYILGEERFAQTGQSLPERGCQIQEIRLFESSLAWNNAV